MQKPKIKYSDFFGCYFVIYYDPNTNKVTTEKKTTQVEAQAFAKEKELVSESNSEHEYWWNKKDG